MGNKINGKVVRTERFTTIEKEKLRRLEDMFSKADYTSEVIIEQPTNKNNYPIQESDGTGFVSVPWENTTYTLRGFVGNSTTVKNFSDTIHSFGNSFALNSDEAEDAVFINLKEATASSTNTFIGGISNTYKKKLDDIIAWYDQQISE